MRIRTITKSNFSGMTLVELLIALSIFTIVIVAVGAFEVGVFSNQKVVSDSLRTAQDAQIILKTMLTELRSAAPGGNGAYPIVSAATSSVTFFSDPANTGTTQEISYTLIGNTLYRSIIPPTGSPVVYNVANQSTSTLVTNIRNSTTTPVFQYFDQNFTGTSSPLSIPVSVSSIRLVTVSLTLDVDVNRSPLARTYTVKASLRNLKSNL